MSANNGKISIRTKIKRIMQLFTFGIKDAVEISRMPDVGMSKLSVFRDILKCYFKYGIRNVTYKQKGVWKYTPEQREELGKKCQLQEEWQQDFYENHRFLIKWSSFKYEASPRLQLKRNDAYRRKYNMGEKCFVGHDVLFERHHNLWGTIKIGDNCLIAKHVFIDYSGELIIHDDVALANGVIIETHTHSIEKKGAGAVPGRLEIERGVKILTGSYIADTCHFIGRYARIGAGTYIRGNVLPYSIMIGNPAKIVGFMYSPEEVVEFEKAIFPESERTDLEKYKQDYKKYYIDRRKEIKGFLQK